MLLCRAPEEGDDTVLCTCDGGRFSVRVAVVGKVQPVLVRAWRARQAPGCKAPLPSVAMLPNTAASISHRTVLSQPSDLDYMLRQIERCENLSRAWYVERTVMSLSARFFFICLFYAFSCYGQSQHYGQ